MPATWGILAGNNRHQHVTSRYNYNSYLITDVWVFWRLHKIADLSETCKVLCQIKVRNSTCRWFHYKNTGWFKKMDSISYVYISWTIHGMWMTYITF